MPALVAEKIYKIFVLQQSRTAKDYSFMLITPTATIAEDIDFRPYLEAVVRSGDKTRVVVYTIIVACVTLYSGVRYYITPTWTHARLGSVQRGLECVAQEDRRAVNGDLKDIFDRNDLTDIETAVGFAFPGLDDKTRAYYTDILENKPVLFSGKGNPKLDAAFLDAKKRGLVAHIQASMNDYRKVFMNTRTISIPIVGLVVDENDLGVLSDLILNVLFILFLASVVRETKNLRMAIEKANRIDVINRQKWQAANGDMTAYRPDPSNYEVLIMAQVLSTDRKLEWYEIVFQVVPFTIPVILQAYIAWTDYDTRQIAYHLDREFEFLSSTTIHVFGSISLSILALFSAIYWLKLNGILLEMKLSHLNRA